jgi:hypothetical protein
MGYKLKKSFPRLWSMEEGVAMVVTDLHGDWDVYRRYRDRFVDLHAGGQADCLIFTGDLIHREDPIAPDKSVEIVLDVMDLQSRYGDAVIYLCGNHELPHIYAITLSKGSRVYTPAFEDVLNKCGCRDDVIAFFDSLPFFLRTCAGVTLTHAGASTPFATPANASKIFDWSHQDLLAWAENILRPEDLESLQKGYAHFQGGVSYEEMSKYYLGVSGPDDPHYNDLLRGFFASSQPEFDSLIWPVLFTRCEREYGFTDYGIFLVAMLKEISVDFSPQHVVVAGHMPIHGGHQIITRNHLRLASGPHASPQEAGAYLLFDVGKSIERIEDLLSGLGSVYH